MNFGIYAGDTDKTIYLRLRDSTTGLAKTGLAFNSAGAVASYTLPLAARAAITLATQTVTGAHSDGGFVEIDATNCKGLYRLDLPDAAIASGAFTIVSIEFDGIIEESVEIELAVPKANVTQVMGTALTEGAAGRLAGGIVKWFNVASPTGTVNSIPDAVPGAANALVIAGTNAPIAFTGSGNAFSCISTGGGGTGFVATGHTTGAGIKATGGATGGIGLWIVGGGTSGNGIDVTTTSGHAMALIAAGPSKYGLWVVGGDSGVSDGAKFTAGTGGVDIRGAITGNITGDLSGSVGSVVGAVGSVAGAVGSVTGNVGGNVVGSVGSVVGAVGSVTGAVGSVTGNVGGNVTGSIGSLATQAKADVQAEAEEGLQTYHLDHFIASADPGSVVADSSFLAKLTSKSATPAFSSYANTTDSLEAIRDRGDAAWGASGVTVPQIGGCWTKSGSTYYVSFFISVNGAVIAGASLSSLAVTFYDEDGTDLTFSGSPTAHSTGIVYANGTLGTAITSNRPVLVKVAVTYSAVAYTFMLPGAQLA